MSAVEKIGDRVRELVEIAQREADDGASRIVNAVVCCADLSEIRQLARDMVEWEQVAAGFRAQLARLEGEAPVRVLPGR